MDRKHLKQYLRQEVDRWSAKSFEALQHELRDGAAYAVGEGAGCYQVEVELLESEAEYLHVCVSVDDGGWRAFSPLSTSFIVHTDGRVERPDLAE